MDKINSFSQSEMIAAQISICHCQKPHLMHFYRSASLWKNIHFLFRACEAPFRDLLGCLRVAFGFKAP